MALAAASGNVILYEVIDSLLSVHRTEQHAIRTIYADRERDYAQHRAIFTAVAAQDPDRAADLVQQHLTDILATTAAGHRSRTQEGATQ